MGKRTTPAKPRTEAQIAALERNKFKSGAEWNGNAKGRPPTAPEMKMSIAYLGPDAINTVADIMRNSKNDKARLDAAALLLSVHVSKAAQKIEHDVTVVHASEFLARANAKAREIIDATIVAESLPAPDKDE